MSKNKIQMTAAMKAEVLEELKAAQNDFNAQEERYFNAQACVETMKAVLTCDHELERVTVGKGEIVSCEKCHFYWGIDKLLD